MYFYYTIFNKYFNNEWQFCQIWLKKSNLRTTLQIKKASVSASPRKTGQANPEAASGTRYVKWFSVGAMCPAPARLLRHASSRLQLLGEGLDIVKLRAPRLLEFLLLFIRKLRRIVDDESH